MKLHYFSTRSKKPDLKLVLLRNLACLSDLYKLLIDVYRDLLERQDDKIDKDNIPDKNVSIKTVIKTFVTNFRIKYRFWYDFVTVFNSFTQFC